METVESRIESSVEQGANKFPRSSLIDTTNQPVEKTEAGYKLLMSKSLFGHTFLALREFELPVWCGTISVESCPVPAIVLHDDKTKPATGAGGGSSPVRARRGATTTTLRARVVISASPLLHGTAPPLLLPARSSRSNRLPHHHHGRFVCETFESAFSSRNLPPSSSPSSTAMRWWGTIRPASEIDRAVLNHLRKSLAASDSVAVPPVYRTNHSYYHVQELLNVTILTRNQAARCLGQPLQSSFGLPPGCYAASAIVDHGIDGHDDDDDGLKCFW